LRKTELFDKKCVKTSKGADTVYDEEKMEAEIRRIKRINYTVFAIVVLLVAAILISFAVNKMESNFTVEKWANDPENRVKIVDDMLSEHPIMGQDRIVIEALLGDQPDSDTAFYYLGPERGFISIDSEFLVIEYKDDVAINYYFTTD